MLKGHVFAKQIFGNQIFALFINTFLNGKNGISNNYLKYTINKILIFPFTHCHNLKIFGECNLS